jgi:beta-N-acetylhexosaminidase
VASSAFVTGVAGLALDGSERDFLRDARPWGLILFRRNVEAPEQVLRLTEAFRDAVGWHAPVLVDQEGGRVQRLTAPHWRRNPAARRYGAINDPMMRHAAIRLGARLIAEDLRAVGVTVDCMPVLDVPAPGAHDVIGDRAYAADPAEVARAGRAAMEGLIAGGVLPMMKHIPGHGRAMADSHLDLPVVDAPREDLAARDFAPFAHLADCPAAMTAHVVYSAIDRRPGTISRRVLRGVVRGEIGFQGLLLSDDLSMKALSGSFAEKTAAALAAGCDIALHCNGVMAEMLEVAAAAPPLRGKAARRAEAALARIAHRPEPIEAAEAVERFESLLAVGV